MTIAEAVEIARSKTSYKTEWDEAVSAIVNRYLWLTNPTPLTRELIEAELGELEDDGVWFVGGACIVGFDDAKAVYCKEIKLTTLGDLRWLVSKLRGGV